MSYVRCWPKADIFFGLKLTSSGFACVQRHGGESRWSTGRD